MTPLQMEARQLFEEVARIFAADPASDFARGALAIAVDLHHHAAAGTRPVADLQILVERLRSKLAAMRAEVR